MVRGRVKWFDPERGYGYITGEDGKDHFVHWSVIQVPGCKTLEAGEAVEYDVTGDRRRIQTVRFTAETDQSSQGTERV